MVFERGPEASDFSNLSDQPLSMDLPFLHWKTGLLEGSKIQIDLIDFPHLLQDAPVGEVCGNLISCYN
jgi:hypothetical protein